jgi:hypothetical protein
MTSEMTDIVASLPGGQALIDWFGFCPSFHDATLERLDVSGGNAVLAIRAFRMTSEVNAEGHFVLDRHALVTLRMLAVTGLKLAGDAGSIIFDLKIRRLSEAPDPSDWVTCAGPRVGDFEVSFDTSVGLYGTIYARELAFELEPRSPPQ